MPLQSKAQARYLFATHPAIAKRFADETPDMGSLPERKTALSGRMPNYLVGARGHTARQDKAFGSLTISPHVKRQLKHRGRS